MSRYIWLYIWLSVLLLAASAQAAPDFTLREELNRQWTREYVSYPLERRGA